MQIQPRPTTAARAAAGPVGEDRHPNACNGCHADKPAQWAADRVAAWYGPNRRQEPHYGEAFAAARPDNRCKQSAGPAGCRPAAAAIVRATALAALRADALTGISERIAATRDADPECAPQQPTAGVHAGTATSVRAGPLLRDPVRAVRMAAARGLSSLPADRFDPSIRPAFDAALAEYVAAQNLSLDMPGRN